MENRNYGDLKMQGSGSAGGGRYDEVVINGSGKITGDVECNTFTTNGSSKVLGNLKADVVKIGGSSKIEGNIIADEVKVAGSAHINGDVRAKLTKIAGSTHIEGGLYGEEVKIAGTVHVENDCEAEVFNASGGFNIEGLLNAGSVCIKLGGECNAREIGGEEIVVKRVFERESFIKKVLSSVFNQTGTLNAEVIEGDNIYLEYTNARVVRGNNITIGEGCNIDKVEYRNEVKAIPSAAIAEQKQI